MPQVFGCPNCQNPFQVPDDAAGQAFQCPTCKTTVEVPESDPHPSDLSQNSNPEPEIFQCPHCSGQFGIEPSMYGEHLSCPHCENVVAIGEPKENLTTGPAIVTDAKKFEVADHVEIESDPSLQPPQLSEQSEHNGEESHIDTPQSADVSTEKETQQAEPEPEPEPEPVFEPQPVDHLLPPRFNVPDPVRFPARRGSNEVILPDGDGGYQAVDANVVTITHNGEVYHLKRLTPEQRRRRKAIHNTIAIGIAILLIYLTLKTLGVLG